MKLRHFAKTATLLTFAAPVWAGNYKNSEAPRGQPWPATWSSGNKQFFGTSYESYDAEGRHSSGSLTAPISKVWFTGAQGVLTEIFWPTLDRKQIRDFQFLVSDGKGFFVEERTQTQSQVEWLDAGVPAFRVSTSDAQRNFEIKKTIFTDPESDVLLMRVEFRPFRRDLKLYVLLNPAMGNTPYGDFALAERGPADRMWAWQDQDALALVSSLPWAKLSAGHSGSLDPFQDIARDGHLDFEYRKANDGNVVLAAKVDAPLNVPFQFDLALGFDSHPQRAHERALRSLARVDEALAQYRAEWTAYQNLVKAPQFDSPEQKELYRASVAVLKSMEDKTFSGAFVASPSVPWGIQKKDDSREAAPRLSEMTRADVPSEIQARGIGGYHLVWPRDLYQMAESFIALGDYQTARASLSYLQAIQYREGEGYWEYGDRRFPKAGSFLQNSWLHGEAHWKMLQIDQTSYPILLAVKLWELGVVSASEVRELIFSSADFIEQYGPWSFQERWEENMGVAPSTLAVQIAALRAAALFADAQYKKPQTSRAARYLTRAQLWDSHIEKWTFTETGTKGGGRYYLRIVGTESPVAAWNPNSWAQIRITNGGPLLYEKEVLDGGFLELVQYGVRSAWNAFIRATLPEYDRDLRVNTRVGPGFYRYTGDFYNWDERNGRQTRGMLWPFLSGERARYELKALGEQAGALSEHERRRLFDSRVGVYLEAFQAFATPSLMLPEQVWSEGAREGRPTGAATPLGWAHGDFVRLLREVEDFKKSVQKAKASLQ
jgi:glucoamylase